MTPKAFGDQRSISIVDRRVWLPEIARGRRVLHLGCVDEHETSARHGTGGLLHEQLDAVASELVGVDLSVDGLREIAGLVPGHYIHGDVEQLDSLDLPECDLVIAAEIIEHLGAPSLFLQGLHRYLVRTGATAVLTTPNAYSWRTLVAVALRRPDPVHPDHRLLFSLATLSRVLSDADLRVTRVAVHNWTHPTTWKGRVASAIDRAVLGWSPLLAVGLIVEVRATS